MARKFLYAVAILIMLAVVGAFVYRIWGERLMTAAMVPTAPFEPIKPLAPKNYAAADMWYARPDLSDNPSLWTPGGAKAVQDGSAAVFFVHPTSYLDRKAWNAPLNDGESADLARTFIRNQASAFNGAGDVWAPRYRQATFGAFLTDKKERLDALDAAYGDIRAAFLQFLEQNPARPIILAAHSQGSAHLLRLMQEVVAGTPIAGRIVAAYVVGWPVSVASDLPAIGLPACERRTQAGCVLSWQSFAEPADPQAIQTVYDAGDGLTGKPRRGTRMLCTNPLTGTPDSAAAASRNLGTLKPDGENGKGELVRGAVPARCDRHGYLLIGDPPNLGPFVLPGNNYHVYDYSLFWANVRADANERLKTFLAH